MRDDVMRLRELLREGKCCSVALVQMALERQGSENKALLDAASALCQGVRCSRLCGALTGAACMMSIIAPAHANALMVPELAEWFAETMQERYGGADCGDILGGDPLNKTARCPSVIEATYLKATEILERHGYEFK